MEFTFTEAEQRWREEVASFLREEAPRSYPYEEQHHDWTFHRKLAAKGWLTLDWPKEYRGQEPASKMEQLIFHDELGYSWAPVGHVLVSATTLLAHILMAYGTEELRRTILPGIARGDFVCAQGFTEPDAGSDVAALKTRATPDGDHFVLNGQKVFSSSAHYAKYYIVAARTDPESSRHRGLSCFLVDLESPGIEIRPLAFVCGGRNNEVFLDNVRVHKSALIGKLNEGWAVMQGVLGEEHGGQAPVVPEGSEGKQGTKLPIKGRLKGGELGRAVDELCRFLVEHGVAPDRHGRALWHALADVAIEIQQHQLRLYHEASLQDHRFPGRPLRYTPLGFIPNRELYGKVADVGLAVLGPFGLLERGGGDQKWLPLQGRIAWMQRMAPMMTIAGGTHEIAKNVAVRYTLGLPKSY